MDELERLAEQAVSLDQMGQFGEAITAYKKAAFRITQLIEEGRLPSEYLSVGEKYMARVRCLLTHSAKAETESLHSQPSPEEESLKQVQLWLEKALTLDEQGNKLDAVKIYIQTAEFCLERSCAGGADSNKFHGLALHVLERAEVLKGKLSQQHAPLPSAPSLTDEDDDVPSSSLNPWGNQTMLFPKVPTDEVNLSLHASSSSPNLQNRGANSAGRPKSSNSRRRWSDQKKEKNGKLEANELRVLSTTSRINTRTYVPFIKECDLNEKFNLTLPFTDKGGLLPLSEKQRKKLSAWRRLDELAPEPKVIDRIDSGTIKQTIVTDCSFVASLAVCARFERRFGTKLITNIIYPQNKQGEPIYNSCGKYMIRLHINGIWRKIIVDDFFPVGHDGELLCSHSKNKNEFWVSLLEKGYLKVMGGYDFPGSNSNIDLNALTGWIPERIPIRPKEATFDANRIFERLFSHFHQGHCLITLATGHIEESEQERTGLVDSHAYAVLDLRKVDGKCIFLVKNPWTHLRWKGRFSEKDTESWSPEMCAKLDYNPKDAQQFDDGIFWIDYASICAFFDVFYVNWSPALFPFSYALHASWEAGRGPVKDLYTVGENPQYFLEVNNRHGTASVWILLSRHITDKEDFANNREYITVMVYKNDGKRVYLPHDPKPITEGTRINSPHYLCQLIVNEAGIQRYTMVIAQYEKMKTINYTLRVYCSTDFKCGGIRVPYKYNKKEAGEWRGETAGGCGNGSSRETFEKNPLFHVTLDQGSDDNALVVDLRGPKEYSIGFELFLVSAAREGKTFEKTSSGTFRPGFTVLQLEGLPAGTYALRPMTFLAGQEGPFILSVSSSCNFALKLVR